MPDVRLWIAWEEQRRNRSLSHHLSAELHEITYSGPRLLRHIRSTIATARLIRKRRPTILFVQNPSLVLSLLAVDGHSKASEHRTDWVSYSDKGATGEQQADGFALVFALLNDNE